MRSHPAKHGEGFDAPPTLERSGSEHRRAVTSLALLERARAWEWVKDPPSGEGQVGQNHITSNSLIASPHLRLISLNSSSSTNSRKASNT